VLDTAYVVADRQPMARELVDDVALPDAAFRSVVLDVLYRGEWIDHRNTLFYGATRDDRVGGMFSFVPCLPAEEAAVGFARPKIALPGVINERSRQSEKRTPVESLATVQEAWDSVVTQVLSQGLVLGVYADTPTFVETKAAAAEAVEC